MKTHKAMLKCSRCDKEYTASSSLKVHMRTHSGEKPHACTVCDRRFTRRSYLTIHMRMHSGEKPFMCSLCGKTFRQRGNLVKHSKVHMGVKPFVCDVCSKPFAQRDQLENHLRVHSGWKPFVCKLCGKAFTQASNLYTHEKIHSGVRPFKCEECGVSFIRKADFEKHHRTHIGVSPYICLLCNKGYKRINVLFKHIQKMHSSQKHFGCGFCFKEFVDVQIFSEHVNFYFIHNYCTTHEDIQKIDSNCDEGAEPENIIQKTDGNMTEYPKPSVYKSKDDHIIIVIDEKENTGGDANKACNKSSTKGYQGNISRSVGKKTRRKRKTKSFKCMICGKTFRFAKKFDVHMKKHKSELCDGSIPLMRGQLERTGEQPFECDVCHKTFPLKCNLAIHMKAHAREKPHACYICSKLFSSNSNLAVHLKTHMEDKTFFDPHGNDSKGHQQTANLSKVYCAEESFNCNSCSKVFNDVRSHRRHMKAHMFTEKAGSPQKLDGPNRNRTENHDAYRTEIGVSELGSCIKIEVDASMEKVWKSCGICVSENRSVIKKIRDESREFLLPLPESVTIEVQEENYGEILGV